MCLSNLSARAQSTPWTLGPGPWAGRSRVTTVQKVATARKRRRLLTHKKNCLYKQLIFQGNRMLHNKRRRTYIISFRLAVIVSAQPHDGVSRSLLLFYYSTYSRGFSFGAWRGVQEQEQEQEQERETISPARVATTRAEEASSQHRRVGLRM